MGGLQDLHPGWPHTSQGAAADASKPKPKRRGPWTMAERAEFGAMWAAGETTGAIADRFAMAESSVYTKAACLGLGRRKARGGKKKARKAQISDGSQRRFTGRVHDEESGPKIVLEPHHPSFRKGSTVFPRNVVPARNLASVLKCGSNSRKLGKTVTKGRWKGFPIKSLTLEERDTCPRTCLEWASCYGNNMHWANRVFDDGTLTRRIWGELASFNAQHPAGFVVRLHVLGDFFDTNYVHFWRGALNDFPALRIFGFTARLPSDPIGAELRILARDFRKRIALRFSGGGEATDCAEVVDRAEQATGILCPAQRDEKRCCANCGLCWATNRTISFLRH